jgi:hypothetical protein
MDREPNVDDVKHALVTTLEFYGKELDNQQWRLWWSVLKQLPPKSVLRGLRDYLAEGKYAPKPANIVELCSRYSEGRSTIVKGPEPVRCPDHIAKAWQWYIAFSTKDTQFAMFQNALDATDQEADDYIEIVNREAARLNQPDAILPEHKISLYWG